MDYQSNSNKSKKKVEVQKTKNIEKVVTGTVVRKPKPIGRKFKDIFLGGDVKDASGQILANVLLPALRTTIVEAISRGVEQVVFGESRFRSQTPQYRPRIEYNNPNHKSGTDPRTRSIYLPDQAPRGRVTNRESSDVIVETREEAELVVEKMMEILDKFESVSLADLCDIIGVDSSPIDNKWGWTMLHRIDIRPVRNGYLIDLPATEAL